ncbi:MAG: envelope stress response membrane protein PspC [Parasphingopyxis sp.]|jgi:phage shock protein C|uniref:envelope stress response membrane protein PspC n=1 Tax=Parasphingopyxis sp. TaxID=1920299 RepID=UPI003FA0F3E9
MHDRRTKFYLDKQNAKFLGVCSGVADYTGIDTLWTRIGFVVTALFFFPPLFLVYFVVAWLAPKKPLGLYEDKEEEKFWQGTRANPRRSVNEIRSRFRDVDRRLADVELMVTSRNTRLAQEIDALR